MADHGGAGGRLAGHGDNSPESGNLLSGTVHGPAVQAQAIYGNVYFNAPGSGLPVPGQLLPVPANFTGRVDELSALDRMIADHVPAPPLTLAVILGVGGIGKTSLVLRWLHAIRDRFAGGQLYADLGGHVPDEAAGPGDVLGRFLRALGLPPERVPTSFEERGGLFRSLTDGRRLIVMLDNAASAAQVRALLPGCGPSVVAVTSRWRIAGLAVDGARFLSLGPLAEKDCVELLDRVAGPGRAQSEPAAAREVARLCAGLPLAVCVAGARLAPHPSWPVQRVAAELTEEQARLAALSVTQDLSVRSAFDISYQALPPEAARLYWVLALIPGPSFSLALAAATASCDEAQASCLTDLLVDASLLEEIGEDRFRFHDLVRLHAREHADTEPAAERDTVIARCVDWYLNQAVAADLAVIPGRWHLGPRYEQAQRASPAYPGPAAALAWLDNELPGLLASVRAAHDHGLHARAWQLCEALWGLFLNRKHFAAWIASHQLGIISAHACADHRAEARMRVQLAFAYLDLKRYTDAAAELNQALALDRREHHRIGEATALELLGQADLGLGHPDTAIEYFTQARLIHQELNVPRGVALMTCRIGEALRDAARYPEAIQNLAEARRLLAGLPDPFNEARALTGLGQALLAGGQHEQAAGPLKEALASMTALGSQYEQARIHTTLIEAARQSGDEDTARSHLETALEIYTSLGAPEAAEIRQRYSSPGPAADPPHDSDSETEIIPPP